ncbi:MAG: sigma-54 dependent transcriptional regulator [Anaerolineales bacterium]|nr:sigma-54 dependent transcriptional regulator [Anaerolineales bacterium]MCX7756010.1 sigma-54 dependent transcriptional regulator [Anaerolineales bacterium]MDW8277018.1 sigma-54 dependent transcriptional regulator [Anaerolineales bacterium]
MSATILVVDDEENARHIITSFLTPKGYEVIGAATLGEARQQIARGRADIILLDVQLPDGYGPSLLEETARLPLRPPIILITAYGDIEMAVEAMKNGAHDFLQKPIQLTRLEQSILRAQEVVALRRELSHLRAVQRRAGSEFVTGSSPAMQALFGQARRAAQASVSVLITGETGTGKEVLARFIHANGPRAEKPFIAVNCAAIQNTMLESELFGYEAGAFTGADRRKPGLLEVADGGILFLDEISSMPLDIQAKLLRVLEERAFRRVGGTNLIRVDVQVLAASNRPLPKLLAEGQFREDLYYRLKVVDLHIPPLRERKEDILELAGHFVRQNNLRMGLNITDITTRAADALRAYPWPGNVRELRNAIERAMLFCDDPVIDLVHLPSEVTRVSNQ